ncbi:MAG TPA: glycosyl hydrolase family 8 [Puia sp.]|jgi:oligosaccharide reducing-end xylanase
MKALFSVFICFCTLPHLFAQSRTTDAAPAEALRLGNGKGAYATGRYRNLFKESGHSEAEITAKINKAFQQLFHGDSASQAVYFTAGANANGSLAYVSDVPHHDIRSEGMSYGMMIAVQLDKKAEFDAIWNYAMTYMYISDKAHPSEGYFSWSLKRDGTPNEETPAPDGEEYFVMSLYFAAGRWGNGQGIYNYQAWADKILTTMRHHPLKSGPTKFGPRNIATMVNEDAKMIRFVPGVERGIFSDPSYHLPAFYELWARWGPKADRAFWAAAADTSRVFFQRATNPRTGLAPDYANFDGTPFVTSRNTHSANFSFDSWRTASNWSVDWAWWQKDEGEQVLGDRIQAFFASQGSDTYGCQYTLNGEKLDNRHASGLVATNAVASLAATQPLSKKFTEALWNLPVPQVLVERYYDGLLYIMSLLHCSGRYRIYEPGPWNNKQSAVVLTYDDAINIDLDNVLPALDSAGLKATFYLIGSSPVVKQRLTEWQKAAAEGHELGNHSLFHPCDGSKPGRSFVTPATDLSKYTVKRAVSEIRANNDLLGSIDGKKIRTFAYPCGDLTIGDTLFYDSLKKDFAGARGVRPGLEAIDSINLSDIRCYGINGQSAKYMIDLVKQNIAAHRLLVFLFHGVGGGHSLNVSLEDHRQLIRFLKDHQNEIWIAPMVDVAEYVRGRQAHG